MHAAWLLSRRLLRPQSPWAGDDRITTRDLRLPLALSSAGERRGVSRVDTVTQRSLHPDTLAARSELSRQSACLEGARSMTRHRYLHGLCMSLALALASPLTHAQSAPSADAQGILHDAGGMTLYTYDPDTPGRSLCSGPCAKVWPPVMAAAGAVAHGPLDLAVRDDGSHQWAVHGHPLYVYVADVNPGQASGDGVNGRWHIAHLTP